MLNNFLKIICVLFTLSTAPAHAETTQNETKIINWFDHIFNAFSQLNYEGVFVYAHGNVLNSFRIIHQLNNGIEKERITRLDGSSHELIRIGANVTCIHQANWKGDINHHIYADSFAKSFVRNIKKLRHYYNVKVIGNGLIAGRNAMILIVQSKDEYRYSYKLWLDKSTGILLKSTLIHFGQVLETFQFIQLNLLNSIPDTKFTVDAADQRLVHYPVPVPNEKLIDPRSIDWDVVWKPAGFTLEMKKLKYNENIAILSFSDGMTSFSVYIKKLDNHKYQESTSHSGATVMVTKKVKSNNDMYIVTVIGEIPLNTAQKVANSIIPITPAQK